MVEIARVTGEADKNLVKKWNSKFFQYQQARINFERQWHQNIAFYFGRQWIVLSRTPASSGGFMLAEQPAEDKWRVRHTANRVKRIIRTELTKLSKEEPQFYCLPASTDESDRAAAQAGDSIADWLMHNKYFNKKRMEATLWSVLCGTSFLKNWYDENKLELDGQPGKIDFDAVTAFHLFVPHLQMVDIQEQPDVIHAKGMTPEEIYLCYDKEVKPSDNTMSTIMDSRFLTSMGIKQSKNEATKMCYVKEVWTKPCKDFPNGAMFVISESDLLYCYEPPVDPTVGMEMPPGAPVGVTQPSLPFEGSTVGVTTDTGNEPTVQFDVKGMTGQNYAFPYRHGRYPFAKIDHIPTGMFYATSVIQDLIPLQKEYNRTRSIMLENRNMAGKPQWSYTKGAFDPKHFTAKPGLLLPLNLSFEPPKPLEQPPLPPNVTQELEVIKQDMDDVSAQFEVAKGRTPPGVEAASAIAYLQEENDTVLHHTIVSLEAAVQETGVQVLANVYDYWDKERIINLTSKNQSYEVTKFKGAMINPLTDFRVEAGSMAPRSVAAKQAFLTELVKLGVIDFRQAAKYLQMSETNKMYEEMLLDDRHAQRENMKMADGESLEKPGESVPVQGPMGMTMMKTMPKMETVKDEFGNDIIDPNTQQPQMYIITTNSFDNHDVHVRVHQDYMKTEEYELLPPNIQQIFEDHVDEHKREMLHERAAIDNYNNVQQPQDAQGGHAASQDNPQQMMDQQMQPSPNGDTVNA